jgi:hypothetical protein
MNGIRRAVALATLVTALACGRPTSPAPFRITTEVAGPGTRLTLHPAPHLKISARLPPALELADGTVIRFSTDRLTPDSAYFAVPPSASLTGHLTRVHGTLHASVCRDDEQVCRSLTLEL